MGAFEELGRFTNPSLLILVSLAGDPKHGYTLMEDVERLGGAPIGPGTLYGALARLEARGLIEALPSDDRRRPYKLTAAGAEAARTQVQSLQRFVRLAAERVGV
ncbi:MAG TPA: PadR family transcriptional regulator [Limnochordia bacterium]|nr:PadR family transcriptional regulator [Limnochordia bacterium]